MVAPPLRRPVNAPVGDRYGPRGTGFHAGLDFPAASGTPVTAAASGRVAFAGYDGGWGLTVTLDHGNGLRTRYAHLSATAVTLGTPVAAGTRLGARRSDGLRDRPPPALRGHASAARTPTPPAPSESKEPKGSDPLGLLGSGRELARRDQAGCGVPRVSVMRSKRVSSTVRSSRIRRS